MELKEILKKMLERKQEEKEKKLFEKFGIDAKTLAF